MTPPPSFLHSGYACHQNGRLQLCHTSRKGPSRSEGWTVTFPRWKSGLAPPALPPAPWVASVGGNPGQVTSPSGPQSSDLGQAPTRCLSKTSSGLGARHIIQVHKEKV